MLLRKFARFSSPCHRAKKALNSRVVRALKGMVAEQPEAESGVSHVLGKMPTLEEVQTIDDLDTLRQVVEGMERYFAKVAEDMIRIADGKPTKRREASKPTKRRRADVGGDDDDDDDDAGWETCSDDEEDDDA